MPENQEEPEERASDPLAEPLGEIFEAEALPPSNGKVHEAYEIEDDGRDGPPYGPRGRGRPKRVLTPVEIKSLAVLCQIQCTFDEICAVLGMSKKALLRMRREDPHIRRVIEEGYSKGRVSLRRHLFRHAEKNVAAAIFLAKNLLGYRDVSDNQPQNATGAPIELSHLYSLSADERRARIAELSERRERVRLLESAG